MTISDISPVVRQRWIIEAIVPHIPSTERCVELMRGLATTLGMYIVAPPYIKSVILPCGRKGIHIHLIWTTSGCSLYIWPDENFLTVDVYTCQIFSKVDAFRWFNDAFHPTEWRIGEPTFTKIMFSKKQ